jgi:hypothetical protein
MHKQGNLMAGRFSEFVGMQTYLLTTRVVAIAGAFLVLAVLARNLVRNPKKLKTLLLFIPIALTIDLSLVVIPIERIHYPQYGFLTWLAYKAIGNPLAAVMFAFVAGYVDETYQYFNLYADDRFVYFDWNDIMLNLMSAIGVLLFFLPAQEPVETHPKKHVLAAMAFWILTAGLLVLVMDPDRYLMGNQGQDRFWIRSTIDTTYHVLTTLEGSIFVGLVLILTVGAYLPRRSRIPAEDS